MMEETLGVFALIMACRKRRNDHVGVGAGGLQGLGEANELRRGEPLGQRPARRCRVEQALGAGRRFPPAARYSPCR